MHCKDCGVSLYDRIGIAGRCEPCHINDRDGYPCLTCGNDTDDPNAPYCRDCAADWSLVATA